MDPAPAFEESPDHQSQPLPFGLTLHQIASAVFPAATEAFERLSSAADPAVLLEPEAYAYWFGEPEGTRSLTDLPEFLHTTVNLGEATDKTEGVPGKVGHIAESDEFLADIPCLPGTLAS